MQKTTGKETQVTETVNALREEHVETGRIRIVAGDFEKHGHTEVFGGESGAFATMELVEQDKDGEKFLEMCNIELPKGENETQLRDELMAEAAKVAGNRGCDCIRCSLIHDPVHRPNENNMYNVLNDDPRWEVVEETHIGGDDIHLGPEHSVKGHDMLTVMQMKISSVEAFKEKKLE